MTKNDGPIEWDGHKLMTLTEGAPAHDTAPADVIAALLTNPELRMQVLEQMPEYANGPTEAAFTDLERRAAAAEAALAEAKTRARWLVRTSTGMPYKEACRFLWEQLLRLFKQPPPEAREQYSGPDAGAPATTGQQETPVGVAPSRGDSGHPSGSGATKPEDLSAEEQAESLSVVPGDGVSSKPGSRVAPSGATSGRFVPDPKNPGWGHLESESEGAER